MCTSKQFGNRISVPWSTKKQQQKEKIATICNEIISGSSLSEAIKTQKEFTDYEYFSLKIGEETGTLQQVTEQLGAFYARKNEQRRNIISALTYPIIILTTAVLVVGFMLQYVVPMFQDIFLIILDLFDLINIMKYMKKIFCVMPNLFIRVMN